MLDRIFDLIFSSGYIKFLGVFLWGVASVILSPCGISIVPLVVGYISNTDEPSKFQAFKISCAFCSGIILNLILVAFVTSGVGYLLGGYEKFLTLLTSLIFILMGLHMAGIIKLKFFAFGSGGNGTESQNIKGAIFLGIISGLAIGPCNIAYISPVLSIAISLKFFESVLLILIYALGYSFVLILAGIFSQTFTKLLESSKIKILNIICGIALILGGIYLLKEFWILI